MTSRTVPLTFAAVAALLAAVAYVLASTEGAPSSPQGHVYTGVTEEPDDVNPFTANSAVARRYVLAFTHDGLLDLDPASGDLRPALAESWQLDADGSACTFTLREGVRFADGEPLSMADVMFGWELARAGHLPLGFVGDAFARVASAEALDDRRLRVVFRDRHYALLRVVGENWLVGRRAFFEARVAAQAARLGRDVPAVGTPEFAQMLGSIDAECGPGTGPYRLDNPPEGGGTWRRRLELLLVRNEFCWRRQVHAGTWSLGGVRLLFRDGPGAVAAFVQREVDWHGSQDPARELAERPQLAAHYRVLTYDHPALGVFRIAWNCRRGPCTDARVRTALTMLCDRAALAAKFPQHAGVAEAFAKPGSAAYPPGPGLPFDPEAARARLREAGFDAEAGTPLRIVLLAPRPSPEIESAVGGLQDAARSAGVDLVVRLLDFPAYVAERKRDEWDGEFALQSFRPWGDPYDFVHSDGADNDCGYRNPEVDRLAAAARGELDRARRDELWRRLHALVREDQPFTFLLHPRVQILFNRHIEGAEPGPLGLSPERFTVAPQHQRR